MRTKLSGSPATWMALLMTAAFGLIACEKRRSGSSSVSKVPRPTLSFYQIPECFLCQQLSQQLAKLERDYSESLIVRTVDYHRDASQTAIARFRLGTHGIVITTHEGDELFTYRAHTQDLSTLYNALEQLTR